MTLGADKSITLLRVGVCVWVNGSQGVLNPTYTMQRILCAKWRCPLNQIITTHTRGWGFGDSELHELLTHTDRSDGVKIDICCSDLADVF